MKERIDTNPHLLHILLKRNKNFPNSRFPVLIYQQAIDLPAQKNKAAAIVHKIFAANGWSNSWTNGIYDFHHYHSNTHECMGVCMGSATVILGGSGGKRMTLRKGDVVILPAGVGHKCLRFSADFQCVGAYPQGKDYDINTGLPEEMDKALMNIRKLTVPLKDPLLGNNGFLRTYWKIEARKDTRDKGKKSNLSKG